MFRGFFVDEELEYNGRMAIFHVISVVVPMIIAVVVPAALRRAGYSVEARYRGLLYAACGLFFISWYLPSPLIDGQDTSFVTHLVGGGLFTGLVWWYLKLSLDWRAHWLLEGFSLFALVSALGCINELAEIVMVKAGLARITLTDTSWDIVANTVGALLVYVVYLVITRVRKAER